MCHALPTIQHLNGAAWRLALQLLLYENSSHLRPNKKKQARSMFFRNWFTRSTCPLVWGWQALLNTIFVHNASWKPSRNWTKILPQLELIFLEYHAGKTILAAYNSANYFNCVVGDFGQVINDNEDCIASLRSWEPGDKVHLDVIPFPLRYLQWLE